MRIAALVLGFAFLVAPYCAHAGAAEIDPIAVLSARIRHDGLYTKPECISYILEGLDDGASSIALREKHDANCGGDPDVAPLLDRFRVNPTKNTVEWYDAVEDEFVPYSTFLARHKRR